MSKQRSRVNAVPAAFEAQPTSSQVLCISCMFTVSVFLVELNGNNFFLILDIVFGSLTHEISALKEYRFIHFRTEKDLGDCLD